MAKRSEKTKDINLKDKPSKTMFANKTPANQDQTIIVAQKEPQVKQMRQETVVLKNRESVIDVLVAQGVSIARAAAVEAAIRRPQPVSIRAGFTLRMLFADFDGSGKSLQIARLTVFSGNKLIVNVAATDKGTFVRAPYE